MKKYEGLIIFKPSISKESLDSIISEINEIIEKNKGETFKNESLGVKELATPIQNVKEGHYLLIHFSGNNTCLTELDAKFKVTEAIMRHIIVDYYSVYKKESIDV